MLSLILSLIPVDHRFGDIALAKFTNIICLWWLSLILLQAITFYALISHTTITILFGLFSKKLCTL